jgi:hypothetical protein
LPVWARANRAIALSFDRRPLDVKFLLAGQAAVFGSSF